MDNKSKTDFLYNLYYDENSAGSYSGINTLFKEARKLGRKDIKISDVRKFLNQQEVHSIFSRVHRKKNKPKLRSYSLHYMCEGDCGYLNQKDKQLNRGYSFFLLVVNVLSLKIYCEPLKSLKSLEVSKALSKIFKKLKVLFHFRTDGGPEFRGQCKFVYEKFNVKHYTNVTSQHAPLAEVKIKQLKKKLTKIMYAKDDRAWIKFLPSTVKSINNTASAKLNWYSPNEVEDQFSSAELYQLRYHNRFKSEKRKADNTCVVNYKRYEKEYRFDLGAIVRLTKVRHAFTREYSITNTHELYLISSRKKMDGISMYTVKSLSGEDLDGFFYDDELVLVSEPLRKYKIKEVLDSKYAESGEKYFKVNWTGYGERNCTWLSEAELGEVSYLK